MISGWRYGAILTHAELPRVVGVLDLQSTDLVLQQQGDRTEIGVRVDSRDLLLLKLFGWDSTPIES